MSKRVAVVEDRTVAAQQALRGLRDGGDVECRVFTHGEATRPPARDHVRDVLDPWLEAGPDAVFIDLQWRARAQDGADAVDRAGIVLEGLRVLRLLLASPTPPRRIVCYSTDLAANRLHNIIFREPVAEALGIGVLELPADEPTAVGRTLVTFHEVADLTDGVDWRLTPLVDGATGDVCRAPVREDYAALEVAPSARMVEALFEVERYTGYADAHRPDAFYQPGRFLQEFFRPDPSRRPPRTPSASARRFIRHQVAVGRLEIGKDWHKARRLLHRVAGYDLVV